MAASRIFPNKYYQSLDKRRLHFTAIFTLVAKEEGIVLKDRYFRCKTVIKSFGNRTFFSEEEIFKDAFSQVRVQSKLFTTVPQLEDELTQLCRPVNESSPSSLPVPFTVDPPCSTVFPDNCALNNAQISKPSITFTRKTASITTSKSWLPDQPRGAPAKNPNPGPPSSDLGTQEPESNNWKKKLLMQGTVAKHLYPSTGANLPFSMTDSEYWSLEAQTLSCGN